ncbi:MAG TPA: hypothetical protein VKP65_20775 [Rhodothermales bacterium]|nr:hypothetical protein [Rhodothermales bacterium]
MPTHIFIDIIGWAGALALLVAYALVSMKRLEGNTPSYQWLNLFGGACLVVNTAYHGAFPSTFLNFVWAAVAVATLLHVRRQLKGRWPTDPDDLST